MKFIQISGIIFKNCRRNVHISDIESLFTELFNKYYNSLINYCIAKNIREQDADDIVSEAFARAYEKSEQVFPLNEKQQRAWLYSAVSLIIKEEFSKNKLTAFSELDFIENYAQEKNDIDEFHDNDNFDTCLREIRENLGSDKERELFELIFDKKIDYKTLSEKYGITPDNCRVMISRFRSKIRAFVNKVLIK